MPYVTLQYGLYHELRGGRCSGLPLSQPSELTFNSLRTSASSACTATPSDNTSKRTALDNVDQLCSRSYTGRGAPISQRLNSRGGSRAGDHVFTALGDGRRGSATRVPDVRLACDVCLTKPARHSHTPQLNKSGFHRLLLDKSNPYSLQRVRVTSFF